MNELYSVAGKVAVISGAAGALGGSLARHFAAQGADVVALVHRPEQVEPTVASLKALGLDLHRILADNDAYHALQALDGLIITGPTGTNVNDVAVALLKV